VKTAGSILQPLRRPVASEEVSNLGWAYAVVYSGVPMPAEVKISSSVEREEPVLQHGSFGRR
jgi:hypothetical protein